MSKHEFIQDAASPSGEAPIPLASEPNATPKMALAGVDTAKADTAKTEAISASLPKAPPVETATKTVGHKIDFASAVRLVLRSARGYRIPEPTRQAHLHVNALRRSETP